MRYYTDTGAIVHEETSKIVVLNGKRWKVDYHVLYDMVNKDYTHRIIVSRVGDISEAYMTQYKTKREYLYRLDIKIRDTILECIDMRRDSIGMWNTIKLHAWNGNLDNIR